MRVTMVRRMRCGLLAAAMAALAASSFARAADPPGGISVNTDGITYKTHAGDTLSAIAGRLTSSAANWPQLGKFNGIVRDTAIPIGTLLQIPAPLLADEPSQAQVIALFGKVAAIGTDGKALLLRNGSLLGEGVELQTASNSFVTLALPDVSHLSIPSNSRIKLSRLRMARFTKSPRTEITILRGNVEAHVTPLEKNLGRFEIRSPMATAAVRGTHFRVGILPDGATATELLSGAVEVRQVAGGASTTLLQGQGNLVAATGLAPTVALLAAPELRSQKSVQSGTQTILELTPVAGASAYHLQISSDAEGQNKFAETRSVSPHLRLDDVPEGAYFVRLSAIDAHGLEGFGRLAPVTLVRQSTAGAAAATAPRIEGSDSRQFRLKWQPAGSGTFNVQVAHDAEFTWLQFNATARQSEISLPRPPFGTYFARVRPIAADGSPGPYSAVQGFIVTDQWIIHDGEPTIATSHHGR